MERVVPFDWNSLHGKSVKIYVAKDDYHNNKRYVFAINEESKDCYLLFEETFSIKESEELKEGA